MGISGEQNGATAQPAMCRGLPSIGSYGIGFTSATRDAETVKPSPL